MTYTSVKSSGAEVGPQPNSLWSNSIGENFAIVLFLSLSLARALFLYPPYSFARAPARSVLGGAAGGALGDRRRRGECLES